MCQEHIYRAAAPDRLCMEASIEFLPFCVPLWQWTARTLALIRLRFQSTSGGTKPTCGCLLCQRQHPITAVRGGLGLLLSPQLLFTGHPVNPNCSMSMSWLSSFHFALFWLMPRHRIMAEHWSASLRCVRGRLFQQVASRNDEYMDHGMVLPTSQG